VAGFGLETRESSPTEPDAIVALREPREWFDATSSEEKAVKARLSPFFRPRPQVSPVPETFGPPCGSAGKPATVPEVAHIQRCARCSQRQPGEFPASRLWPGQPRQPRSPRR